jgi:ElaB/YqjD/DUF883 family membrane-anchored ribosome-binding protein
MNSSAQTTDWLIGAARRNPEGLLLLAAGCALLLRARGSRRSPYRDRAQAAQETFGSEHRRQTDGRNWDVSEGVSRAADRAREFASDVGKTVGETTGSYAAAASEYADATRRAVGDQSGRLADRAQKTMHRVVQEQPWTAVVLGLAAGAAVAVAFPSVDLERRTLGRAGERLSKVATSAASSAGEQLMSAADEKGLNAGGLKDVARDVVGAAASSMLGEWNRQADAASSSGENRGASAARGTSGASGIPPGGQGGRGQTAGEFATPDSDRSGPQRR